MFMSLEEINKLPEPTKSVALSLYNDNIKVRAEAEANAKIVASLRDAKLKEARDARQTRVALLSARSPKVKADLDAMLALPAMALSLGDGGQVIDPMASTLDILEKGLVNLPALLTSDRTALSIAAQPTDDQMTKDREDELADSLATMMGCAPRRAS